MAALTRAFPYDTPADHCCYKVIFFDRIVNEKLFRGCEAPEDALRSRKFLIQHDTIVCSVLLLDVFGYGAFHQTASRELSES